MQDSSRLGHDQVKFFLKEYDIQLHLHANAARTHVHYSLVDSIVGPNKSFHSFLTATSLEKVELTQSKQAKILSRALSGNSCGGIYFESECGIPRRR